MKDYSKMADNYFDNTGLLKQYPAKSRFGKLCFSVSRICLSKAGIIQRRK